MLNKLLYEALVKRFGDVVIINPDHPGEFNVPDIPSGFAKGKQSLAYVDMINWGELYNLPCPICKDYKKRLFISHRLGTSILLNKTKKGYFSRHLCKCHNEECQSTKTFQDLIKDIFTNDLQADYPSTAISQTVTPTKITNQNILVKTIHLPDPCYRLSDPRTSDTARDYLQTRGFDLDYLDQNFDIRYSPTDALTGWNNAEGTPNKLFDERIIIPHVQHMHLIGWQGRALTNSKLKYMNSKGSSKTQWIYNLDKALMYPEVMIFEGVTNVWRTGVDSVAIFGKSLSVHQAELLKIIWSFDGVGVLCFDEDTYESNVDVNTAKLLMNMKAFGNGLSILRLRNGDAARHTFARMRQLKALSCDLATSDPKTVQILDENDVPAYNGDELRLPRVCTKPMEKTIIEVPEDELEEELEEDV